MQRTPVQRAPVSTRGVWTRHGVLWVLKRTQLGELVLLQMEQRLRLTDAASAGLERLEHGARSLDAAVVVLQEHLSGADRSAPAGSHVVRACRSVGAARGASLRRAALRRSVLRWIATRVALRNARRGKAHLEALEVIRRILAR